MEIINRLRWRPGLGDPSIVGWLTVAAYLLVAVLAWRTWSGPAKGRRPALWLGVALLMGGLSLNKQLDFQSLLTDIGRVMAHEGGWYKERRHLQKSFVIAVLAIAVLAIAALASLGGAWWVRRSWRTHGFLAAGLLLLLTYVALRAVSFLHIDVFLRTRIGGAKFYWLLEWVGILLIAAAALRTCALQRQQPGFQIRP